MTQFEWIDFLIARNKWSIKAFGEGQRTEGICRHIESELNEIRETPNDLYEWVDVILLALDGAFRAGHSPYKVMSAIYKKHQINTERDWGDTVSQDSPTFHNRVSEEAKRLENEAWGGQGFSGGPSGQGNTEEY